MTNSSTPPANSALELEFPDWSGMKEHPPMKPGVVWQLTESYYGMLPKRPDWMAERWAAKCQVEFVL